MCASVILVVFGDLIAFIKQFSEKHVKIWRYRKRGGATSHDSDVTENS